MSTTTNHLDFENLFSDDAVEQMLGMILVAEDLDGESLEAIIKHHLVSVAAMVYSDLEEFDMPEDHRGLAMLILGYKVGFQAGHLDGHLCVASEESTNSEFEVPGYL
ncbi:hypothetical protein IPM44_03375 [bacterium]|nr:MAG: hypothetical protein IPM44_03375 [bacterium]